MSNAVAVEIADAVAAGISAHEFSAPYASISAVRRYVPDYEAVELAQLKVSVVPGQIDVEKATRLSDLFTHEIAVVLGKQTDGTNEEVDALTRLGEEVMDAIRSGVLVTTGMPENVMFYSATMQQHFDRDAMSGQRVYLGQILVQYRVPRGHLQAS